MIAIERVLGITVVRQTPELSLLIAVQNVEFRHVIRDSHSSIIC
jgi:hypothetical protein